MKLTLFLSLSFHVRNTKKGTRIFPSQTLPPNKQSMSSVATTPPSGSLERLTASSLVSGCGPWVTFVDLWLVLCLADNCKRMALCFDDVISSVEIINCQGAQVQVSHISYQYSSSQYNGLEWHQHKALLGTSSLALWARLLSHNVHFQHTTCANIAFYKQCTCVWLLISSVLFGTFPANIVPSTLHLYSSTHPD